MAIAAEYQIELDQSARWGMVLTMSNPDETPMDLAGFTARMMIRRRLNTPAAVLCLGTDNGRIVIENTDGDPDDPTPTTITFALDGAETALLEERSYYYDIQLIPTSGLADAEFLMRGTVQVGLAVTRTEGP